MMVYPSLLLRAVVSLQLAQVHVMEGRLERGLLELADATREIGEARRLIDAELSLREVTG